MSQDKSYHSKRSIVRKHWTQAKQKSSWENSKLCILMCDVKALFRCPISFNFVDCNTLLFLGLIQLPVNSSPQQVYHCSGTANILGSPSQSKLHLHSLTQWPESASLQGHPCHMPDLRALLNCRDSTTPFLCPSLLIFFRLLLFTRCSCRVTNTTFLNWETQRNPKPWSDCNLSCTWRGRGLQLFIILKQLPAY